MTIGLLLKHILEYMNAFLFGNVRPYVIMAALKYVFATEIYRSEGIVFNVDWEEIFELSNIEFTDEVANANKTKKVKDDNDSHAIDNDDIVDIELVYEKTVHDYGDTHWIDDLTKR